MRAIETVNLGVWNFDGTEVDMTKLYDLEPKICEIVYDKFFNSWDSNEEDIEKTFLEAIKKVYNSKKALAQRAFDIAFKTDDINFMGMAYDGNYTEVIMEYCYKADDFKHDFQCKFNSPTTPLPGSWVLVSNDKVHWFKRVCKGFDIKSGKIITDIIPGICVEWEFLRVPINEYTLEYLYANTNY